ncbi:MAG: sigma-54-dependent Fis family transcriptional regulator [Acidobacteria bacterium]|nr:sigma-54-dependent Fis family transcriptional regulator [Acidobacteriota bacterium]
MKIPVLQFRIDGGECEGALTELEAESPQELVKIKSQMAPAAVAIRSDDLHALRQLRDVTIDRGRKHRAKQLSKLLLGCSKIPLIDGGFTSAGQCMRSIRTLLGNASRMRDRNVYVIGLTQKLFDEIGKQTDVAAPIPVSVTPTISSRTPAQQRPADGDNAVFARTLLDLLHSAKVPSELETRYVGRSAQAQLVRALIMHAAASGDPVLITGDTGTGKEVVAKCIHEQSWRKSSPFTPVNCGAIPSGLLEPMLFGHQKIFTGADRVRAGLWRDTQEGTIFLDEIGDLEPRHQVKILRALQEKKVLMLGSSVETDVSARVVVATNRDLFSLVQAGLFREDLYYRLRGFMIRTPTLRECPEDIPLIAAALWKRVTKDETAALPEEILQEMQHHRWPGNSRDLNSVLSALHSLFGKGNLRVEQLRAVMALQGRAAPQTAGTGTAAVDMHRAECLRHLKRVDEVIQAGRVAARALLEEKLVNRPAELAFRDRLAELDSLCRHPLLFQSEVTFSVVHRLQGKLAYFHSLLPGGTKAAARYWKRDVVEDLKLATSTIFQEVGRLMNP